MKVEPLLERSALGGHAIRFTALWGRGGPFGFTHVADRSARSQDHLGASEWQRTPGDLGEGNGEQTSRLWGSPRRQSLWGCCYPWHRTEGTYGAAITSILQASCHREDPTDRRVSQPHGEGQTGSVRLAILVRPNAVRAGVGGNHDGALVVRVAEPADRGRATGAALRALAKSFGVPTRNVTLIQGPTSRRKLVEIAAGGEGEELLRSRLQRLLQAED